MTSPENRKGGGAKTGRTQTVSIRVNPDMMRAATLVAGATGRTVSSFFEYAAKRYIDKNFPDAWNKDARLKIATDDAPSEVAQ